jgi:hypothetical protein
MTWTQSNGSHAMVYRSDYRSGTWSNPTSLTTNRASMTGQDAYEPRIAMDSSGNTIITWFQSNATRFMIYKAEYRNNSWTDSTNLLTDNISPTGQAISTRPELAMDNDGNAIITWSQSNGTYQYIYKSEYRNGAWVHPSNLATDFINIAGSTVGSPTVAMGGNNSAMIWYTKSDGSNTKLYKNEYRNGTWVNATSLTTDAIGFSGSNHSMLAVRMDAYGSASALWGVVSGGGLDIRLYFSDFR